MKCKGGQMVLSRSLSQCQSYISTPLSKLSVNDDDVADEDHNDDDNDDDDDDDHDLTILSSWSNNTQSTQL